MRNAYISMIESNFHFFVARYRFSQSAVLSGCVNVDSIVRRHCSLLINDRRFAVAQFLRDSILLRDTVGKNVGCYTFTRNDISCIVNYLATA